MPPIPVKKRTRRPLSDVKGWLNEKDPFFRIMDEILAARHAHRPRRAPGLKGRTLCRRIERRTRPR